MVLLLFGWILIPCAILATAIALLFAGHTNGVRGVIGCLLVPSILFALFGVLAWVSDTGVYRDVAVDEIAGKWRLDSDSLSYFIADGYIDDGLNCEIVFHGDKTVEFASVNGAHQPPVHERWTGTWGFTRWGDSRLRVELFKDSRVVSRTSFGLSESSGNLYFSDCHGDPDSLEFIEYSKGP